MIIFRSITIYFNVINVKTRYRDLLFCLVV